MIGRLRRAVTRLLGSPRLALVLIVFVGAWSLLATVIPPGEAVTPEVAEWVAASGWMGALSDALGLTQAFTAPVFVAATILLTLCTAVCSWSRTRVAFKRTQALRRAVEVSREAIAGQHDLVVPIQVGLSDTDALANATAALAELGIKAKERDGVLRAASPPWSVWGSPVFHWALVLLVLAAFAGVLFRAEGSMTIPIGETKTDEPFSYASVEAGPLHDWERVNRSIRVESFDPAVTRDGIDLGAVPTVSVLDANGEPLVTQEVYPNNKLHARSLSINAPTCGLSVTLELVSPSGSALPPVVQLVDFSQEASGGTVPAAPLVLSNNAGQVLLRMSAIVPLDRAPEGGYGEWIPKQPSAHVILRDGKDTVLFDGVVRLGETRALDAGGTINLTDVGWYSRLSLVDDPSIPYVYASMIAGMLGLSLSLVSRQHLLLATIVDEDGGRVVAMRLRLWRNVPATRDEIERSIVAALSGGREGTLS